MWHMGVDTTTNPACHTQAQSIIKAQKDIGTPRFSQPGSGKWNSGRRQEKEGVLPQSQRVHPDRLFPP